VPPNVVIERVDSLPVDLEGELMQSALQEGFMPLQWLKNEWDEGINRFSKQGEAFYVARTDARLVGVCGLNEDHRDAGIPTGRLRRLYVLPEIRRRGIGRRLVAQALEGAAGHFRSVQLRTLDQESAAFFEAIGFTKVEGVEGVTHRAAIG
jgi:N-acetylglutamate synthase-like GNAT family acetyltransferase